jgi:hypothetical protein
MFSMRRRPVAERARPDSDARVELQRTRFKLLRLGLGAANPDDARDTSRCWPFENADLGLAGERWRSSREANWAAWRLSGATSKSTSFDWRHASSACTERPAGVALLPLMLHGVTPSGESFQLETVAAVEATSQRDGVLEVASREKFV